LTQVAVRVMVMAMLILEKELTVGQQLLILAT
jgi:hypothetical protein